MINLPTGFSLTEGEFNKFILAFEQIIEKAVEKKLNQSTVKPVQDILMTKKLTGQQMIIAKAIFAGKTNKEIAEQLKITESAVKNCTTRVYKIFQVGSRVQFLALRG